MLHTGTVLLSLKYYEVTIGLSKVEGKINVGDNQGTEAKARQPHH